LLSKDKIIDPNPTYLPDFWIVGFIEAEGSFYLTKKDEKRIAHGFGLTQKEDKILLDLIRKKFNINSRVKFNKKGFWSLNTTASSSILILSEFFFKKMKGMKAVEFRIWSRSHIKYKGNY
jgi:hypothetical protein